MLIFLSVRSLRHFKIKMQKLVHETPHIALNEYNSPDSFDDESNDIYVRGGDLNDNDYESDNYYFNNGGCDSDLMLMKMIIFLMMMSPSHTPY
jgi:hypothetical protein